MGRNRAIGIVINEDEALVVRRVLQGHDYCVFPGGGIEASEDPETAAIREIQEETNIDAKLDRLLYRIIRPENEQYFFLCSYVSGEPALNDPEDKESMAKGEQYYEPKWVKITDLPSTPLYPLEIRDRLMKDISEGFSADFPVDITATSRPF